MHNRLSTLAEVFLPVARCGLHTNGGTRDMILQQIPEKCIEKKMPLYIFVDFPIAFETMNREALWNSLSEARVLWPLRQVRIFLEYSNENLSKIKGRTLGTIWGWEWIFFFYGLVWCLHWFYPKNMVTK